MQNQSNCGITFNTQLKTALTGYQYRQFLGVTEVQLLQNHETVMAKWRNTKDSNDTEQYPRHNS